jgi:hypothetical protein
MYARSNSAVSLSMAMKPVGGRGKLHVYIRRRRDSQNIYHVFQFETASQVAFPPVVLNVVGT